MMWPHKFFHFVALVAFSSAILLGANASAQSAATPNAKARSDSAASSRDVTQSPAEQNANRPVAQPTPGLDSKTGLPLYETIQEDWGSLQIGTSKLEPETPILSEPDDEEKFTRSIVRVKWRPGDAIDLWISVPKGVKNPPVVLYLYGVKEDVDRFRDNAWCERATSGGVAAVGFVAALTGERFHDRPMKQWFVSELQESLGSTVHDVKFILDYLASRGDVDMTRVGMFGEGSGGAIAVLAAAADPRVKVIDLLEPWGDWPHFLAKSSVVLEDPAHENYVKPEFLKKVEPLDPVKWLPTLKIPIRMQQIKADEAIPMESKDALKAAAPQQTDVRRFPDSLTMFQSEKGGVLFSWVKDRLNDLGRKPAAVAQKEPGSAGTQNAHP